MLQIWLSQHILRNSSKLLKSSLDRNASWYWHLKWILSLNIDLLNSSFLESFATPLRIIEELTLVESYKKILGLDNAILALRDVSKYKYIKLVTKIYTLFNENSPIPSK